MNKEPKVSILMPVFNGGVNLKEAINSIIKQKFIDFEFLIINDGSTDNSESIIKSFGDKRIKLINNSTNLKLIKTLNKGIKNCNGEYIIRMDADDISNSNRISELVSFMDKNQDVGVCGTFIKRFIWKKFLGLTWKSYTDPEKIRCEFLFENPIAHPSTIIRKKLILDNNISYDSEFIHAEDYFFWVKISEISKISNLSKVLLYNRIHSLKISNKYNLDQIKSSGKIRLIQLEKLGIQTNVNELIIHNFIVYFNVIPNTELIIDAESWLLKIKKANHSRKIYQKKELDEVLFNRWFKICKNSVNLGLWVWDIFWASQLTGNYNLKRVLKIAFFIQCVLRINFYKIFKRVLKFLFL